jgi:hypothetical protein
VVANTRTAGSSAAINAIYTVPNTADSHVAPFADGQPHVVFLSIGTRPATVRATSGSTLSGMAIRFTDPASGGAIDVFVQAFGTAPAAADSMTFDASSKLVTATTSFKDAPSFGQVYVGRYLQCNGTPCGSGDAGYAYGIDQTAFAQLVAAARALNPTLSSDIRTYTIANFRFVNQATLDGEIGVKLWDLKLYVYGLWYED